MRLLQLVQQQLGLSRRRAETLIKAGRVTLDGAQMSNPYLEIEPRQATALALDGKTVEIAPIAAGVYKYYKPVGMLCSFADPHHHHAMGKVLRRPELKGYKIVGHLDRDAEGLLLLTNDGQLLNHLAHPRYEVEKVYHVWVPKVLRFRQSFDVFRQMKDGIEDQGERLVLVRGAIVQRTATSTLAKLVLTEGKKHEVKRLCRHFGWTVQRLIRVEMAGVHLGPLKPGELHALTKTEIKALYQRVRQPL